MPALYLVFSHQKSQKWINAAAAPIGPQVRLSGPAHVAPGAQGLPVAERAGYGAQD